MKHTPYVLWFFSFHIAKFIKIKYFIEYFILKNLIVGRRGILEKVLVVPPPFKTEVSKTLMVPPPF